MAPSTRIIDATEARRTILKRKPMTDASVPPHVQSRIDEMFGKPTTPLECVQAILSSICENGDDAVCEWSQKIDSADLSNGYEISVSTQNEALQRVNVKLVDSLRVAARRIEAFHREQPMTSWFTNKLGGTVGQAVRPIDCVGVYAPGGTAPLPSTVLMSAIPALVAGVKTIIVVSPPLRNSNPPTVADVTAASVAVLRECAKDFCDVRAFAVGGAQAIGALAYGTQSIPKVDKIVGPGNVFVSLAKKEVFGPVGIDGVYGPTEALVVADDSANPQLVAADLLAQAEHDFMAVPILVTDSMTLAESVQVEVEKQLEVLSREDVARAALSEQGGIVVASSMRECLDLSNEFAAEHVSLAVKNPWSLLGSIKHAGGVFLGEGSCEVLGDYVAGPSHVMPTGGTARYSSPLSILDFVKVISVVALDEDTVREIAPKAEAIARAEGLDAHANAAALRKEFRDQ